MIKSSKAKRVIEPGNRARVVVADDSSVMRTILSQAISSDPQLEVAGKARNGEEAVRQVMALQPDVVTLDVEMPEMDGLEALRRLRQVAPQVRVVMVSSTTERGAATTFEALALGADDYLAKMSFSNLQDAAARLREQLIPKLKQFFSFEEAGSHTAQAGGKPAPERAFLPVRPARELRRRQTAPRILAMGVSTGGPTALAEIVPQIPAHFDLPVMIVQHMPPVFTRLLCERLQEKSKLIIREAIDGEAVAGGTIYVAPGDFHMCVKTGENYIPRISLNQNPPENSCRPAVDVLFRSLAEVYRDAVLGVILTGMGYDGLLGARQLKAAGSRIFAQDEGTSAVWGMPRAVAEAGIAEAVLPINRIIPHLLCTARHQSGRHELEETRA